MRAKGTPRALRVPSRAAFRRRKSIGSMPKCSASSSMTVSAANAVARAPGAREAADFHGDDFDLALGLAQQAGGLVADHEGALVARPDRDLVIGVPEHGRILGLDIALVDHLGREFALDHHLRFGEAGRDVAGLELV